MIDPSIPPLIDDALARLQTAYGIQAETLERAVHKVGRRLPPRQMAHAKVLLEAERLMGHPKLARQLDATKVAYAHEDLVPFLDKQDLNDQRKGRVISVVATIMVNLLILAMLIAVILAVVDR
ncbi:MAG: hypothetical protein AAF386_05475 [Pseudomonadota bacterium]